MMQFYGGVTGLFDAMMRLFGAVMGLFGTVARWYMAVIGLYGTVMELYGTVMELYGTVTELCDSIKRENMPYLIVALCCLPPTPMLFCYPMLVTLSCQPTDLVL